MAGKNAVIANLDMNVRAKITELEKNLKKVEGQLLSFQKVGTGVAASLKRIGEQAAGTFAGLASFNIIGKFTSGITGLVSKFTSLGASQFETILGQESLAAILQVSGNTLRAFSLAAERATLGQAELEAALIKTGKNVKEGNEAIDELNLSYDDLATLSIDRQFLAILEALEKIPNANRRVQLAMELWGRSGAQILQASSKGFRQAEEDVKRFGLALSSGALENIDKLHVSLTDLWARIKGLTNQLLAGLSPMLTEWFDKMGAMWDKLGSHEIAQRVLSVIQMMRDGVLSAIEAMINGIRDAQKFMYEAQLGFMQYMGKGTNNRFPFHSRDPKVVQDERREMLILQNKIDLLASKSRFAFDPQYRKPLMADWGGDFDPFAGFPDFFDPRKPNAARKLAGESFLGSMRDMFSASMMSAISALRLQTEAGPMLKPVPESFANARQGSAEAHRAITEAHRAYIESQNDAAAKRHKESVDKLKDIERAIGKTNLVVGEL